MPRSFTGFSTPESVDNLSAWRANSMTNHYYGTTTALAWMLGHYFYGAEHRAWVAGEYFPYRLPNPKSSNPHLIYQDLYQPWKDRDNYDKYIGQARLNARKSVIARELASHLDSSEAGDLKDICDRVDIVFLYPFVVRVDVERIRAVDPNRLVLAGSALSGSHEFLIERLRETPREFVSLFLDFHDDVDFRRLVYDEQHGLARTSALEAKNALLGRRI